MEFSYPWCYYDIPIHVSRQFSGSERILRISWYAFSAFVPYVFVLSFNASRYRDASAIRDYITMCCRFYPRTLLCLVLARLKTSICLYPLFLIFFVFASISSNSHSQGRPIDARLSVYFLIISSCWSNALLVVISSARIICMLFNLVNFTMLATRWTPRSPWLLLLYIIPSVVDEWRCSICLMISFIS